MPKNRIDARKKVQSQSVVEMRAVSTNEDEMIVEGYAVVFNQPTVLWVDYDGTEYKEIIDRHAFDEAIMDDVPFKYNHDDKCMIPARSRKASGEGSLLLSIDDYGLKIRAHLANTTASRDLYRLIDIGLINKMSFAFTYDEELWNRETNTTTITKINKLWDVSAVDDPAYPQTSISSLRSATLAEAEAERKANEIKLENEKLEAEKQAREAEAERLKVERDTKLKLLKLQARL